MLPPTGPLLCTPMLQAVEEGLQVVLEGGSICFTALIMSVCIWADHMLCFCSGRFVFLFFFSSVLKHFGLFKHTDISYFRVIIVCFLYILHKWTQCLIKRELNECLEMSLVLSHHTLFNLNIQTAFFCPPWEPYTIHLYFFFLPMLHFCCFLSTLQALKSLKVNNNLGPYSVPQLVLLPCLFWWCT